MAHSRSSGRRAGLPSAAARVLVVAAAVLAVVVLAGQRHDLGACTRARSALFLSSLKGRAPAAEVDTVSSRCRDPQDVAIAAVGLARTGLAGPAIRLARIAVDRAPAGYAGWAALAEAASRGGDAATFARAVAHARRLNPRWVPPAPPAPSPSAR